MKQAKVQNLRALREEMKAVARGERLAPADASKPSFNSVEAVVRLLTPANRRLLALIRDRKPRSVAELVTMTGRAQPNLTRTLAKFEAADFITMKTVGRRKTPSAAVKNFFVEIDSYSDRDRLRVAFSVPGCVRSNWVVREADSNARPARPETKRLSERVLTPVPLFRNSSESAFRTPFGLRSRRGGEGSRPPFAARW
jgi:predicted transcriptional regulator